MMRLCLALLAIAGLMVAPGAMSSSADDQDACRIGAVSPEEYGTIAAEVAAMPPIDWDAALAVERYQSDDLAAALRERLGPVLDRRVSTDQQIAAMHAVMRSTGAEFTSATRGSEGVIYHYRLDVNWIGMIRLLSRWATVSVMFGLPAAPGEVRPAMQVSAMMPEMLDPGRPGYVKVPQERPCPPMPLDAPTRQERTERLEQQG
jgi:hypothetical protein